MKIERKYLKTSAWKYNLNCLKRNLTSKLQIKIKKKKVATI